MAGIAEIKKEVSMAQQEKYKYKEEYEALY